MAGASGEHRRSKSAARGMLRAVPSDESHASPDNDIDLGQLWAAVVERWRFVLAVGVLVLGAAVAHALSAPMSFKSSGRLYLGDLEMLAKAGGGQNSSVDIQGSAQGDVGSEIEILKSQTLVAQAIRDSGYNVTVVPTGWSPPRTWQWLLANRNPEILDVPSRELGVRNAELRDNSRGEQHFVVEFESPEAYRVLTLERALLGRGKLGVPLQTAVASFELRPGTERVPAAGARYDLYVRPLDVTTDQVVAALQVTPAKGIGAEAAKVVTLELTDGSPHFCATLLLSLMNGYLSERQAWKAEDASAAESFVTNQLRSLRASLDKSEQKLADYRSNTRPVVLENEASAMIAQVSRYEEQRVAARLQVAALNDVKRVLKLPNPPAEAFLVGEANDTVLAGLANALTKSRQLYLDNAEQFGPKAAQTRHAQGQVQAQLQMVRNYVSSRLVRAQENLASLTQIIAQFEERLKTVPGAELGLAQLGRESEVYSRVYSYMLERQQQAAIIKASTVSKNRVLDFPKVPYREDAPKLKLRLAGGPLGLLFGALLVLLYRICATTFQSQTEIRRALAAQPIYATIPQRNADVQVTPDLSAVAAQGTLEMLTSELNSAHAEAFRTLRTNLYQTMTGDQGCVVVAISSPQPNDGKTTCTISLAEILVADKKRVLVVDADLRKPSHHVMTSQPLGLGLRGILSGQCEWTETAREVRLGYGSFKSISAGKLAPAELLSSERMDRFLTEARRHHDYILLDAPSYPLVSDALVLAEVSDCVLSVLRVRNSPRKTAADHIRRLSAVSSNYGAIIVDSTMIGVEYPLRPRESPARKMVRRALTVLERPMLRFIGGRFSLMTFWMFLCVALICIAGIVFLLHRPVRSAPVEPTFRASSAQPSAPLPSPPGAEPVPLPEQSVQSANKSNVSEEPADPDAAATVLQRPASATSPNPLNRPPQSQSAVHAERESTQQFTSSAVRPLQAPADLMLSNPY